MPSLVSRMDAAAALRKPTYSQVACAPTKLAEYLGCGVPCLVNRGIGDVEEIVETDRVGAVDRLLAVAREPDIEARCVASARSRFSLDDGVEAYRAIYRKLLGESGGER